MSLAERRAAQVADERKAEAAQKLDAIRASMSPAGKHRKGTVAGVEDEGETA